MIYEFEFLGDNIDQKRDQRPKLRLEFSYKTFILHIIMGKEI